MWTHAFKCLGIPAQYFRLHPIDAEKAVRAICELPLSGCTVTAPFKRAILKFLDETDESSRILGAVNTIKNANGRLIGCNTECYAIVNALKEGGIDPTGKKAVVLGINDTAQAVVYGLLKAKTQEIVLLHRAYEKAIRTAERLGCRAAYFGRAKSEIQSADILIACVPLTTRIVKKAWLHRGLAVVDTNFSSNSSLLQEAEGSGCSIISGLSWLVHQAALAFELFFHADPVAYMREAMKMKRNPHTSSARSIAMIGFMGAGKTSVGRHLARMTGMEVIDTDRLIEEKVGKSIPEFFKAYGEDAFRAIERSVFETLDLTSEKIISCGGGVIKDSAIRTLLSEHSTIIWLWSSLSTTLARISRKGLRPLLGVENIEEQAKKIFTERVPLYAGCADLMIINETVSTSKIAKRIYDEIYPAGKH
jgi:shikimate dehydrogenase